MTNNRIYFPDIDPVEGRGIDPVDARDYFPPALQPKAVKPARRFKNAHEIWNVGASNPRGVARALVEAIDEAVDEGHGSDAAKDPAVQMIADHLCFLIGLPQPSLAMSSTDWDLVMKCVEEKL